MLFQHKTKQYDARYDALDGSYWPGTELKFGYGKVRYRGLAKNTSRLYVLSAFTNLLRAEKYQAL